MRSLAHASVLTLAEAKERVEKYIKEEDIITSKDDPFKRSRKEIGVKRAKIPQKEGPHMEPRPNQREVYLVIHASLPKAMPMKEESIDVHQRSGKYCVYHQDSSTLPQNVEH